jgi:hypothetical protein
MPGFKEASSLSFPYTVFVPVELIDKISHIEIPRNSIIIFYLMGYGITVSDVNCVGFPGREFVPNIERCIKSNSRFWESIGAEIPRAWVMRGGEEESL